MPHSHGATWELSTWGDSE